MDRNTGPLTRLHSVRGFSVENPHTGYRAALRNGRPPRDAYPGVRCASPGLFSIRPSGTAELCQGPHSSRLAMRPVTTQDDNGSIPVRGFLPERRLTTPLEWGTRFPVWGIQF